MNARHLILLPVLLAPMTALAADRVEERDAWTETWTVTADEPLLDISNIWGNVIVQPGAEGEITLSVKELRSAPTPELLTRSHEALPVNVAGDEAGVSLVVGHRDERWQRMDPCRHCRVALDIEVRVPRGARIDVATVNEGRVSVSGITGPVSARNVNGPVTVEGAHACEELASVNGAVRIGFDARPGGDCSIETINGDIRLSVPADSGLDIAMDLFNGRVVSALPVDPLALPARIEHSTSGGRHRYTIDQPAGIRIAGGGPVFSVSSMNGDVRIQKNP